MSYNIPLIITIFISLLTIKYFFPKHHREIDPKKLYSSRPLKAFVLSAYYYPKSKSLGDNALALVMAMNLGRTKDNLLNLQWGGLSDTTEITVMVRNKTTGLVVKTDYIRVTPHDSCQIVTVFATLQLLPNPISIHMVSMTNLTQIPFKTPHTMKREVVMCISPVFVSEQWQNFLLAVHVYKQFGAHMHLYFISAVTSLFELMKEYEKSGYLTIQAWDRILYPFVPGSVADAYSQIEFQNLAAAQTDCLLQYKESAEFIGLLDLTDILIPRLAPTYIEEFQKLLKSYRGTSTVAYLDYEKEHYEATVFNNTEFSLKDFMNSFVYKNKKSVGKIVLIPERINYTYIDRPTYIPNRADALNVEGNTITHLETIRWNDEDCETDFSVSSTYSTPFKNQLSKMESSLQRMFRKPKIAEIVPHLPNFFFFYKLVRKCIGRYYELVESKSRNIANICPGTQLCGFYQHPRVKCVHVNGKHIPMGEVFPITYYFSTDIFYSADIGCYAQ